MIDTHDPHGVTWPLSLGNVNYEATEQREVARLMEKILLQTIWIQLRKGIFTAPFAIGGETPESTVKQGWKSS